MRFYVVLSFISCLLLSSYLKAEQVIDDRIVDIGQWYTGVAIGYGKLENPLVEEKDIPLYVLPDIRYYGERFSFENLDVSYALLEKKGFVVELIGSQNSDGLFFPGDHRGGYAAVAGIHPAKPWDLFDQALDQPAPLAPSHRSMSYMGGVELRYYNWIDTFINWQTDLSNVHHGEQLQIALQKSFLWQKLNIGLQAQAQYKSEQLTQYYYSIDQRDAFNSDLYYQADAAMSYQFQVNLSYPLSAQLAAVASLRKHWIDNTLRDSPIVAQGQTLSYFFGVKYVL